MLSKLLIGSAAVFSQVQAVHVDDDLPDELSNIMHAEYSELMNGLQHKFSKDLALGEHLRVQEGIKDSLRSLSAEEVQKYCKYMPQLMIKSM